MRHKLLIIVLSFLIVNLLTLSLIGYYSKKYFDRIDKVYNISRELVLKNNNIDVNVNNHDEEYIYKYFNDLNKALKESNKLSYEDYKEKYLNLNFYKDIELSKNDINTYYKDESNKLREFKSRNDKKAFIEYLKSNNVHSVVISKLDKQLDDKLVDEDGRLESDRDKFYSLLKYADYLEKEKDNWVLSGNNIVSENESVVENINAKNKEFDINVTAVKKEIPKKEVEEVDDNSKRIPVLMYHGVSDETWGIEGLFIKVSNFEKQMKYIHDNFETIFIEDIEKDYSNKRVVALTFDDGYADFYTNVFPVLKKYNLKANLYIIVNSRGDKCLDDNQIKEISNSGLVSIGSHTMNHYSLNKLDDEELEKELRNSRIELEKLLGKKVKTLCYPSGVYNAKVISVAAKYYEYALAIKNDVERMNDKFNRYAIKRYRIYRTTSFNNFKEKVDKAN